MLPFILFQCCQPVVTDGTMRHRSLEHHICLSILPASIIEAARMNVPINRKSTHYILEYKLIMLLLFSGIFIVRILTALTVKIELCF